MYTNKVAVLAGDYLLARASVLLARLQHLQVVEVMASALDALVQVSTECLLLLLRYGDRDR